MHTRVGPLPFLALLMLPLASTAATINVPDDVPTLAAAVHGARAGDTIRLAEGRFEGKVVVDKPLTLIGAGMDATVIGCGTQDEDIVILGNADLTVSDLTIGPGHDGIVMGEDVTLRLDRARLTDIVSDGVGFQGRFQTRLFMRDCEVTRCADGVDLESTQGQAIDCDFHDNTDDGLDYDGDAGFLCVRCRFADNGDDGIEVRLATRAEVVLVGCSFSGNPEDNLELINTRLLDPKDNIVAVSHCSFEGAGRWDLGCVDLLTPEGERNEETSVEPPHAAVFLCANTFTRPVEEAVAPNLRPIMAEAGQMPEDVVVTWTPAGGEPRQVTLTPTAPALAGVVNVQPSFDGASVGDAEGLAIDDACLYVGDDTGAPAGRVHCFDRFTGAHIATISTNPFAGTDLSFTGPEGLTILPDGSLLVLNDRGDKGADAAVVTSGPEGFGEFLRHVVMPEPDHAAEGITIVGDDTIYLPEQERVGMKAARLSDATVLAGWPVGYLFDGRPLHLAGVGYDGTYVVASVTAYPSGDRNASQPVNYLLRIDPGDGRPQAIEWIGAYINDARGVACADGFTLVSDGWSYRTRDDGWANKQGQSVYFLAPGVEAIIGGADRLPVRHLRPQ